MCCILSNQFIDKFQECQFQRYNYSCPRLVNRFYFLLRLRVVESRLTKFQSSLKKCSNLQALLRTNSRSARKCDDLLHSASHTTQFPIIKIQAKIFWQAFSNLWRKKLNKKCYTKYETSKHEFTVKSLVWLRYHWTANAWISSFAWMECDGLFYKFEMWNPIPKFK